MWEPAPADHQWHDADMSRRSRAAGPSRRSCEDSFVQHFNSRYAWSDSLIDCLTIAGIGTRLWRGWHKLGPAERWVFGSYIAAVLLHMLWRWAWPRCYSRWRHLTATVLTLVATTLPAFWRRRIQGLAKLPDAPIDGGALRGLISTARVLLVSTYTLQLTVYGMGRPAPLWLKLPTHTLSVGVAASHAGAMCQQAVFRQPTVAAWLLRAYRGCCSLAALLPLPLSPLLPEPSETEACAAVVTFVHVTLGFVLPMLATVSLELRARQQHAREHRQYRRVWRYARRRPWWRLAEWLCSGQGLFHSSMANLGAGVVGAAALWDVVIAVRSTLAGDESAAATMF